MGLSLTLNGEPHHTEGGTIAALLSELAIEPKKIAVEQNREIVPRSAYATTALAEGDVLEVVQFVGGG